MRETVFQDKCLRWVKEKFWGKLLAVNNHGDGYSNKGFPDVTVYGNGKAIVIELKSDSGYTLQEDQIIWRNRFLNVGTPHYVIENNDFEKFKQVIRKEFPDETAQRLPST